MTSHDPTAMGSDVPRSRRQAWLRSLSRGLIQLLRLESPSDFATEFCQTLSPVATLRTPHGDLRFRSGHGRLVWRVDSFFEEEPETIRWLDALGDALAVPGTLNRLIDLLFVKP